MRKLFKITALSLLFSGILASAFAQAPTKVKDKYKGYQLKREVFLKWGDFKPWWFYQIALRDYKNGPDRRNVKQLLPIVIMTNRTKEKSEEEAEHVDVIFKQEGFKFLDRSANKFYYLLYENKFKKVNQELDALSVKAVAAKVEFEMLLKLRQHRNMINEDIKITKESYLDDATKEKQFRKYLADLTALRGYYSRLITVFNLASKHQTN